MKTERQLSSIESSFAMEDLQFDDECRNRVKSVLNGTLSVKDAIAELDEKYNVVLTDSKKRIYKYNLL